MSSACLRLLSKLEFPLLHDIDLKNSSHCNKLVRWLEDRKIRRMQIPERSFLSDNSNESVTRYLEKLNCPYDWISEKMEGLVWLLSLAINADYTDKISMEVENDNEMIAPNKLVTSEKLNDLGSLLEVIRVDNENDETYIRKLWQKLKLEYTQRVLNPTDEGKLGRIALSDFPLGFDTQDETVNQIGLVLNMLYVNDFRDLQNDVNDLMILGQEFTAHPKLNTSLGKVGR